MDWWQRIASAFHLRQIAHSAGFSIAVGAFCFLVLYIPERRAGADPKRYASRHFATDLMYRLAFILLLIWIVNPATELTRHTWPSLDRALLTKVPLWISIPVYWLVFDFIGYWVHRFQHSRIWWRFHRVHHSQREMTFATANRNHPIDQLFANGVSLVPGLVLGAPAIVWLPYSILLAFIDAIHHAPVPWRFGAVRKIFVSPIFHAAHHSDDRAVYDRNFGGVLSIWDFAFGTAVDLEYAPPRTGIAGWQVKESFLALLASPFRRDAVATQRAPDSREQA